MCLLLCTKRSADIPKHFVRTCMYSCIYFFQSNRITKKIVKIIQDEIYSKLFEICKRTKKFVLVKFGEAIPLAEANSFN